jgi:predicted ATPase with chaperone activity
MTAKCPRCFRASKPTGAKWRSPLGKGLVCPQVSGAEAAWAAAEMSILEPSNLLQLVNHLKGSGRSTASISRSKCRQSPPPTSEGSAVVRARVAAARRIQVERLAALRHPKARTNADCDGSLLEEIAAPDQAGCTLLREAADALSLSARGYHRTLRVARTLADLDGEERVARIHLAETLSYRARPCAAPRPQRDVVTSLLPRVAGLSTYPQAVTQHSSVLPASPAIPPTNFFPLFLPFIAR